MAILVRPLHPHFASEVSGLNLCQPLARGDFAQISAVLARDAVVVLRGQNLTNDQQVAFSARFGRLEAAVGSMRSGQARRLNDASVVDVSNLGANDRILDPTAAWRGMQTANRLWHTDSSFKQTPGKYSFLNAHETPRIGGETEFVDLRAAYDALSSTLKARIATLSAEHSLMHSRRLVGFTDFSEEQRAALPPVSRPLVRHHAESGRTTLYLASHVSHIEGWPDADSRALLDELMAVATQASCVFQHSWRVGDLVVWDNSCTMHRGLAYDDVRERRDLRRTTTEDSSFAGEPPPPGSEGRHAQTS